MWDLLLNYKKKKACFFKYKKFFFPKNVYSIESCFFLVFQHSCYWLKKGVWEREEGKEVTHLSKQGLSLMSSINLLLRVNFRQDRKISLFYSTGYYKKKKKNNNIILLLIQLY